jgi:hypothetical protein
MVQNENRSIIFSVSLIVVFAWRSNPTSADETASPTPKHILLVVRLIVTLLCMLGTLCVVAILRTLNAYGANTQVRLEDPLPVYLPPRPRPTFLQLVPIQNVSSCPPGQALPWPCPQVAAPIPLQDLGAQRGGAAPPVEAPAGDEEIIEGYDV